VNQLEHQLERAVALEDLAVHVERSASLAVNEAYLTGYIDGYLQRAEDEEEKR
jgi:hypothetical protein